MNTAIVIIAIGVLIFGAHLFNGLFKYTKIPNVLVLLLVGILVGPVLKLVNASHFGAIGPIFTAITLVLILFESGTNLKIREIFNSIGSAFLLTLFNFITSALVGTIIAYSYFTSLDLLSASFFGVIIAGTSSAVVIPIIKQLKMNEKGSTTLLLESALSDVFCLVIGLALLAAMKQGVFELGAILDSIWRSFLIAAIIGLFAGIVWSMIIHLTRFIENSRVMNIALVFIIYGITENMHFNGGIAVLIFGITLGNAHLLKDTFLNKLLPAKELVQDEKDFFSELVFIMATFFFVYVGIHMQFGSVEIYLLSLLIVTLITLIRPLSVKLLVRTEMSGKDLGIMAIMAPKGLVPAILATIPIQLGMPGGKDIQMLAFAVVLLSIVICSILVIMLSNNPTQFGYLNSVLDNKVDNEAPLNDVPTPPHQQEETSIE